MTVAQRAKLSLLPASSLVKTGEVDHADWNYRTFLGTIARQRFELIRDLLPSARSERLLEIGYGSGVFFPELAKHADALYGIDVHDATTQVQASLAGVGVHATLAKAAAEQIPFEDGYFGLVICVSSLEFVSDMPRVASEIARVLTKSGRAVIVTPAEHPLFDLGLKVLTGKSAKDDFGTRRRGVIETLSTKLAVEKRLTFPRVRIPGLPPLYTAARFHTLDSASERKKNARTVFTGRAFLWLNLALTYSRGTLRSDYHRRWRS